MILNLQYFGLRCDRRGPSEFVVGVALDASVIVVGNAVT